jgi:battenin
MSDDEAHALVSAAAPQRSRCGSCQCFARARNEARLRFIAAFFLLGLLNNAPFVVMNAGAKSISEGSVALVYLANILPGLLIKSTAPYWLDTVPYWLRISVCTGCMVTSFCVVALSSDMYVQLFGVAFSAAQGSMGEATLLALASKYDAAWALSAWSSGTGFAGVFGYTWVALFHLGLQLDFRTTLLVANVLGALYAATFFVLLPLPLSADAPSDAERGSALSVLHSVADADVAPAHGAREAESGGFGSVENDAEVKVEEVEGDAQRPPTTRERVCMLPSLWRYTIPLLTVYFSEYAMQSGTWAAIGIPKVHVEADRAAFYTYANWLYQVGVFISRSSSTLLPIRSVAILWLMPVLQLAMLVFFTAVASLPTEHWLYGWWLLAPCFVTGLFGGAVYVNAFTQIAERTPPRLRELAIATASVADNLGIIAGDAAGLFIQACLFQLNSIPGAVVQCFF